MILTTGPPPRAGGDHDESAGRGAQAAADAAADQLRGDDADGVAADGGGLEEAAAEWAEGLLHVGAPAGRTAAQAVMVY